LLGGNNVLQIAQQLSSGQILVAGGWDSNGKGTNRVDVSAL